MHRTRSILSTVVCTALLMLVAVPAMAGPAPIDPPADSGATSPTVDATIGSDPGAWEVLGFVAAGLLAVTVLTFATVAIVRHTHHHAPHPA